MFSQSFLNSTLSVGLLVLSVTVLMGAIVDSQADKLHSERISLLFQRLAELRVRLEAAETDYHWIECEECRKAMEQARKAKQ
jgi:hypothetical protein